jgi:hypothetical protein
MLPKAFATARVTWIVLRGPFGAPQDEGGALFKQTLTIDSNS